MSSSIVVVGKNSQLGQSLQFLRPHWIYLDRRQLDLLRPGEIYSYFSKRVSTLINFAGFTSVDLAESKKADALRMNSSAVGELAQICDRLIHISTDYVFDGQKGQPYVETDATHPLNYYGETKREGEVLALKNNTNAIVLRTSWLYSQYGVNFVRRMLELAKARPELRIVMDQVGTPTFAGDLVQVVVRIAENKSVIAPGIYHYSNEGSCSWYDFSLAIFKAAELSVRVAPITTAEYPTPARRPLYSVLNKDKIHRALDLEIPHWQTSLTQAMGEILP